MCYDLNMNLIKKIMNLINNKINLFLFNINQKNSNDLLEKSLLEIDNKNKKVFDCFIFDNEIELLDIRLAEYYEYVDYFIIVEIACSHNGNIKLESNFKKNEKIWKKYADKIIFEFVAYDKIPVFSNTNTWLIEYFHRNYIHNLLLLKAKIGDVILISDVDEFWNTAYIEEIKSNSKINIFIQNLYYYFFNCKKNQLWSGTISYPFGSLYPQKARFISIDINIKIFNLNVNKMHDFCKIYNNNNIFNLIPDGGSHFSWLLNEHNINFKPFSIAESNIIKSFFEEKSEIKKVFEDGIDFMGRDEWQHKLNFIPLDSLCSIPRSIGVKHSHLFKKIVPISIGKTYEIIVIHNSKCEYFLKNLIRLIDMSIKFKFSIKYILFENQNDEVFLLKKMNINYDDYSNNKYSIKREILSINKNVEYSTSDNLIFMTSNIFLSFDAFTNLIKHHNGYNVPASRSINNENSQLQLFDIHFSLKNTGMNDNEIFDYIDKLFEKFKKNIMNYGISLSNSFFCISKDKLIESGGIPVTKLFTKNKNYWGIYFDEILRNQFNMNLVTVFDSFYYKF